MKNILMPKLSDTMTEGLFGRWLKNVGDSISRGETIAEVETDKATMGLEAFDDGILLEKRIEEGEVVPVGTVLGVMGLAGEEPGETLQDTDYPKAANEGSVAATGSNDEPESADFEAISTEEEKPDDTVEPDYIGEKASPVVRRRARELGIDLEAVSGSGSGGRVLLQDLEGIAAGDSGNEPVQAPLQVALDAESRAARMRGAIAATVSSSWRDIPHFYVTMEIPMDNAEEIRREMQMSGSPVSVNDLVLKGVAIAISKFPALNAIRTDSGIEQRQDINLGFAVNVANGLLVPVIRGAGDLSLVELAERSRELADLARAGRLSPVDMSGGTFSVSNLGPQGVSQFSSIIIPSQVAILAVGGVEEKVVVRDGEIGIGRIMKVTVSADHRVVDGAYVAGFLQELRSVLENPVRLLI